jgi:hypothetical protein
MLYFNNGITHRNTAILMTNDMGTISDFSHYDKTPKVTDRQHSAISQDDATSTRTITFAMARLLSG